MPRLNRPNRSLAAMSCPHLSRLNGRIGDHDVEFHQRVVLDELRVADGVFPLDAWRHPPRAENMFILHSAQVLPFISWPNREKSFRDPASMP
jgi:hypothetical protein